MMLFLVDLIVVLHLLWIVFLIFGALLGRLIAWVKWLHLGALAYSLAMQAFNWVCPLTVIEVWLRRAHDPASAYAGSFIGHYAQRLVYAPVPGTFLFIATSFIVALTLWVYFRPRA
jgi:hypothetical protein